MPGLYAAGDVSLVARGHLSGAFTYGQITAENATEYARTVADPVIDDEQVMDVIRDRDAKLAQTGGQVPIEMCIRDRPFRKALSSLFSLPYNVQEKAS